MTKRDELLAVAERCEKASEGSRELDARIACVLDNRSIHVIVDGDVLGRNNQPPHDICIVGWAPSYTTSLDAAMTLVPEGWFVASCGESVSSIIYVNDQHDHEGWFAEIQHRKGGRLKNSHSNASLAIALCAAALRAQAEMEG